MRTHKRTISCIVPRGEYFGTWLKGDFVSHYPCLFHDVNTVLDLGCGRQEIKGFMPEGVNYIGIDMDPDCSPNPDIVCDIGLIPLKDDSADIVMALGLDIFKIPGAVREMKRLLRPGGYFVFQGSSEYFHLINARRILRDNGFEIEEEFRQVIEYPEASLRFVYYISRPRREGDGMGVLNTAMAGIEVLRKKGMLWDIIVILIALLFEFMGSEDKATPCQEWSAELASEVANRLQRNKVYRPRENISIPEIWKSSKRKSYRSKNYYL